MTSTNFIQNTFSKLMSMIEIVSEYSKSNDKKEFAYEILTELVEIKGLDEEKEKALIEGLLSLIESFVIFFIAAKDCFKSEEKTS